MKSSSPTALTATVLMLVTVVCTAAAAVPVSTGTHNSSMPTNTIADFSESMASSRDLQAYYYCGCYSCLINIWNSEAPAGAGSLMTCGKRMEFLSQSITKFAACRQVANEFPDICGACNPDTCNVKRTRPPEGSTQAPLPELQYVGNNLYPSTAFPLGKCQGDCDTRNECQYGLACYQRNAGDQVPGCAGIDTTSDTDYCIDPLALQTFAPQNLDIPNRTGTDTFALKLNWQEGYTWQDETFERKWCMRCDSGKDGCTPLHRVYLSNCDTDPSVAEWTLNYIAGDSGVFQVKDSKSNMCLTVPERSRRPLFVNNCNATDYHQQFLAQNGETTWGSNFELNPAWISGACVGSPHQPKYGELLFVWYCNVAREWTTNAWNFY